MGALQSSIVLQRRKKSKNEENVRYKHAVAVMNLFVRRTATYADFILSVNVVQPKKILTQ